MSAGTGLTGNVGGPSQPMPNELEATAAAQTAKTHLGIVPDSLQIPLSRLDYENTWKYKSAANNPTIAPMIRVRVSTAPNQGKDAYWENAFNRLLDRLPSDVKALYLAQARLPVEERSTAFGSLDNVLGLTARLIAYVDKASDPEAAALSRQEEYLSFPVKLQNNLIAVGSEVISFVKHFLQQTGHSLLGFDQLSAFTASLDELLEKFRSTLNSGNTDQLQVVGQQLTTLQNQTRKLDNLSEGSLKVLWPILDVMTMIASSASLKAGTAPLILSMNIAFIGLKTSESAMGLLPLSSEKAIEGFTNLLATWMAKNNKGSAQLLPLFLTSLTLAAVGLAAAGRNQSLDLEMGLSVLDHSGFIGALSESISSALNISEARLPIAKDLLAMAAFLQLIQALKGNESSPIIQSFQETFIGLFSRVGDEMEDTGNFALFVQKCLAALTKNDVKEFAEIANQNPFIDDEAEVNEAQMAEFKKKMEALFAMLKAVRENFKNSIDTGVVTA